MQIIELTLCKKNYLYVKYVHVWRVFSSSLYSVSQSRIKPSSYFGLYLRYIAFRRKFQKIQLFLFLNIFYIYIFCVKCRLCKFVNYFLFQNENYFLIIFLSVRFSVCKFVCQISINFLFIWFVNCLVPKDSWSLFISNLVWNYSPWPKFLNLIQP